MKLFCTFFLHKMSSCPAKLNSIIAFENVLKILILSRFLIFPTRTFCSLCPTYPEGSVFQEQSHIYSQNGLLDVRLIFQAAFIN